MKPKLRVKKIHVFKESIAATVIVLLITYIISFIPWSLEYGKALHQGFADFDIYDLYYSEKNESNFTRDSNIILVQIGNTRQDIAEEINLINSYQPKVIAIDAFFEKRTTDDSALSKIVATKKNLIFINRYTEDGIVPNIFYNDTDRCGFGNFLGQQYSVIRTFSPTLNIDGKLYKSFAACIAERADKNSYEILKKRNNNIELINYKGNLESYTNFTAEELFQYHFAGELNKILPNKIVLLGLFSKDTSNEILNDLHFSPLNKVVSGKSFPDIYGVVIHANIVSMILDKKYPEYASKAVTYLFAFIITFLFYFYMISRYNKKTNPSHTIFLIVQIFSILFVLYFFLKLYDWFLFKVSLEPIMISIVLSLEFFGIYESLAKWLHKKYNYTTVFSTIHKS